MTIGESKLKYITFVFILILLLVLFSAPFVFQAHRSFAQEMKVGPPGPEDVNSLNQNIKEGTKSIFQKIKDVGRKIGRFVSFFENLNQRIVSWWSNQASPWIKYHWAGINAYLNQEIRIE